MPYILHLDTREITEHHQAPEPFQWVSMILDICTVTEGGLGPEYTPRSVRALVRDREIITQTKDDAWDVEYWTRESVSVKMVPGLPHPIVFPLQDKPVVNCREA